MKETGTIQVPVRRHGASVAALAAAGILLVTIGALNLVGRISSEEGRVVREPFVGELAPVIGGSAPVTEGWGFVLNADTAQVLRHRPGLTPRDLLRTHAFGWEGLTIREVFEDPALMKELRLQPWLTPIDLIRLGARGTLLRTGRAP